MMRGQKGATLLIALIMLVVLTLFAVSAINLSTVNMKIVGNMQQRSATEMLALTAIETVLNSATPFYSPSAAVAVTAPTDVTITVSNRVCLGADAASGYSAAQAIVPEDTYWDVTVTVVDAATNTQSVMHQGAKMRMLAGNCPA